MTRLTYFYLSGQAAIITGGGTAIRTLLLACDVKDKNSVEI